MTQIKHDADAFVELVKEMRQKQNDYFRTRGGLDECRKVERAVDKYIREYQSGETQKEMFTP